MAQQSFVLLHMKVYTLPMSESTHIDSVLGFAGQPADNAARFVDWISTLQGSELRGVRYAVFGCGNSDWTQTYQRVPTLIDEKLQQSGGECLLPRGAGDSSKGDFFDIFDQFTRNLWATLTKVRTSSLTYLIPFTWLFDWSGLLDCTL